MLQNCRNIIETWIFGNFNIFENRHYYTFWPCNDPIDDMLRLVMERKRSIVDDFLFLWCLKQVVGSGHSNGRLWEYYLLTYVKNETKVRICSNLFVQHRSFLFASWNMSSISSILKRKLLTGLDFHCSEYLPIFGKFL